MNDRNAKEIAEKFGVPKCQIYQIAYLAMRHLGFLSIKKISTKLVLSHLSCQECQKKITDFSWETAML